jgi:hypothetical protein
LKKSSLSRAQITEWCVHHIGITESGASQNHPSIMKHSFAIWTSDNHCIMIQQAVDRALPPGVWVIVDDLSFKIQPEWLSETGNEDAASE